METEAEGLERMIGRYSPDVARLGRSLIAQMRARIPQAHALVYDNYNALGVGFARDLSSASVIISVVLYPRWVSLFFFKGALLPDPAGLLRGGGTIIRHIRFQDIREFENPEVESLISAALELVEPPLDPSADGRLVIKSVSARQRPRRPA